MQLVFFSICILIYHWSACVGVQAALGGARRLRQASSVSVRVADFSNLPANLTAQAIFRVREDQLDGKVDLIESSPDVLPAPYGAIALGPAEAQQLAQVVHNELAYVPPAAATVTLITEFPGVALRGQSVLDTLSAQQPLRIPTVFAPFHAGTTFRVDSRAERPGVTLTFSNMTLLLPNVTYDGVYESGLMEYFDVGRSGRFCFTNSILVLKSCKGFTPNMYHMWCCVAWQCNILYSQQAIEDLPGNDIIDDLEYIHCYGAEEAVPADRAGIPGRSTDGAKYQLQWAARAGIGAGVFVLVAAVIATVMYQMRGRRRKQKTDVAAGGIFAAMALTAGADRFKHMGGVHVGEITPCSSHWSTQAQRQRTAPFPVSAGTRTNVGGLTTSMAAVTSVYDTLVAAAETTIRQRKARLTAELDHMRQRGELFLGQFKVLQSTERREGGQGVVQFMRRARTEEAVAVKFFLSRRVFDTETQLYRVADLRSMMPAVRLEVGNGDETERNGRGYPWPPCMVLEKGESLQEWKAKTQPAFSTILDALCLIAERLAQLHGSGWAHRDLKPGNVLRLPGQHSWTLMDFGCAALTGLPVPLTFSPSHAPPEVAQAVERGAHTIVADPAADMWAFGVMAFELLTGAPVFPPFTSTREAIWAQLCGREVLPWEAGAPGQADKLAHLRVLKRTVLQCLQRRPEERPTAEEVVHQLRNLFDPQSGAIGRQRR